jgi:hypothetical protein
MANPATIAALLKERGINYLPSHQVEKVVAQEEGKQEEGEGAKGGVELVFCGEGQKRVKASLLVFMPELRGPAVFQGSGLENKKGEALCSRLLRAAFLFTLFLATFPHRLSAEPLAYAQDAAARRVRHR